MLVSFVGVSRRRVIEASFLRVHAVESSVEKVGIVFTRQWKVKKRGESYVVDQPNCFYFEESRIAGCGSPNVRFGLI